MEESYVLNLKNRKFSEFYLCFCGYAKCEPLHSFGPAVRPNYILHLVLEGKGKYKTGEKQYKLGAGEGFLINPEVETFYQADAKEPWSYLWIGFSGSRAEEYLEDIGLGTGRETFRCQYAGELKDMLFEILRRNTYSIENDFLRESFLYSFFAVLSRGLELHVSAGTEEENLYVRKAVEYVQNNYPYGIRVSDIASFVGVSRGYLHTLFVKNLDISPQDYLIRYRLTRAAELLIVTDLPVDGIAQSCGYTDPLVFSKLFKSKMGQTPSAYRRIRRSNDREKLSVQKDRL